MQPMEQEVKAGQAVCSKDTVVHIEIRDTISTIDRASWDCLCGPSQYYRHSYMAALEASGLDCQYLYALAMSKGELIGAAVATIWCIHLPGRFLLRLTTMGTPVNTGLAVMQMPDTDLRYELVAALERASAERSVRVFIGRDFPDRDYFQQIRLDKLYNCAHLVLPWGDFEQYLAQLPQTQKRAARFSRLGKGGLYP